MEKVPEEIRNSASLLIFEESIKKVPLFSCLCHSCKTNIHHSYLVYLNLVEYILVSYVHRIFTIHITFVYNLMRVDRVLDYFFIPG